MKLKKLATLAGLALVLLAISGCSLLTPSAGSISIQMPQEYLQAPSRALWDADTPAQYVRVYLEAQGALIIGGATVFELPIPANGVITIEDVPPITNCTIYITLSADEKTNFRTVRYFKSGTFSVVAGAIAEVNATVYDSPFEDIFLPVAKDSSGVKAAVVETATDSGNFSRYFAANGLVYQDDSAEHFLTTSGTINSLSAGNILVPGTTVGETSNEGTLGEPELWINTSTGIYDSTGEQVVAATDVTDSGIFRLTYTYMETELETGEEVTENFDIAFYQRKGSMGFGLPTSGGEWEWKDLITDMLGEDNSEITDLINPDKNIIAAYSMSENRQFGYFITPVGTLRLDADVINDLVDPPEDQEEYTVTEILNDILKPNTISVDGQKIQTLSYEAGRLVLGTDYGIKTTSVLLEESGKVPYTLVDGKEVPLPLPSVTGVKASIVRIHSKQYVVGGPVWTAALGTGGTLYLLKDGSLDSSYRFYTGMPGFDGKAATTGNLLWTEDGLVITGTDSAVLLPKETIESF